MATPIRSARSLSKVISIRAASGCLSRSTSRSIAIWAGLAVLGYPLSVRRLLYASLVFAVVSYSTPPSTLHVHAYTSGHSHHDHDHGPASHEHDRPAPTSDPLAHLSSCNPATHAVFLNKAIPVSRTTTVFAVPFQAVETNALEPGSGSGTAEPLIEARQHSPPRCAATSPRPPPSTAAA